MVISCDCGLLGYDDPSTMLCYRGKWKDFACTELLRFSGHTFLSKAAVGSFAAATGSLVRASWTTGLSGKLSFKKTKPDTVAATLTTDNHLLRWQKEQNGYTDINCLAQSSESEHSLAIQDYAYGGDENSLLERRKNDIPLLSLTNYDPSVQDLQRELAQLRQVLELFEIMQFRSPDTTIKHSDVLSDIKFALVADDILGNPATLEKGGVYYYLERGNRLIDLNALRDSLWQGAVRSAFCAKIVESADAFIFAGLNHYLILKKEKALLVQPDRVMIGNGPTFGCILIKDLLQVLAKKIKKNSWFKWPEWLPIQVLDEEAQVAKRAREEK
ncbi:hypothetical protein Tco_0688887, partial [Tanacetum coccineum]